MTDENYLLYSVIVTGLALVGAVVTVRSLYRFVRFLVRGSK